MATDTGRQLEGTPAQRLAGVQGGRPRGWRGGLRASARAELSTGEVAASRQKRV